MPSLVHDLRRVVEPLLRHVVLEHVRGLDHVVVDADQNHVVHVHGVLLLSTAANGPDHDVRTGSVSQPRTVEVRARSGLVVVDLPVGEALQHLVERDPALQAGQRGTQAEVDAVAEGEVATDVAVDVEAVAVREVALVPVGRAVEQDHDAALGHRLAVVLDVTLDVAGLHRRRRLVAQQLLDGVGDERAVRHQLAALVGMAAEDLAGPADEPGRRLVPGAGQQADVGEDLVARQRARRARLVLELGVEQLGHEVVGGVLGAPVDVVGEHLRRARRRRSRTRAPCPPRAAGPRRVWSRIASWSCSGMPSSMPMTRMGMNLPEVLDEVEAARADERVEHLGAERAHLGLERVHLLRA